MAAPQICCLNGSALDCSGWPVEKIDLWFCFPFNAVRGFIGSWLMNDIVLKLINVDRCLCEIKVDLFISVGVAAFLISHYAFVERH